MFSHPLQKWWVAHYWHEDYQANAQILGGRNTWSLIEPKEVIESIEPLSLLG